MRNPAFLALLLFVFTRAFTQHLAVSPTQVLFVTPVTSPSSDSIRLIIKNTGSTALTINDINIYNTDFHLSDTAKVLIAGDSLRIWIRFKPRHNIEYNTEILISTDQGDVTVDVKGTGKYAEAYYDGSFNKSEEDLKTALKTIVSTGAVTLGYNTARDRMFMEIDNKKINGQGATQNTLECIYTGRLAVGYTSRTDCQTNDNFNTEHTYPQSLFGSADPMVSDLHHLFPTDDVANNHRSNSPFGVVTNPTYNDGGSKGTSSLYEPRDQQKGRSARALLYFLIRYQNYGSFMTSQETLMRQWSAKFPPDSIDRKRNDDIQLYQKNRNPLVDHPEFLERITTLVSTSSAPVVRSFDYITKSIHLTVHQNDSFEFPVGLSSNGNATVSLTNMSFRQNKLGFGFSPVAVFAYESSTIMIKKTITGSSSIKDTLVFNSDDPSKPSVSIPVQIDVIPQGIAEVNQLSFKMFPNPAKDKVAFVFPAECESGEIIIHDLSGKNISSFSFTQSKLEIETSSLAKGFYLVELHSATAQIFKPLILQ